MSLPCPDGKSAEQQCAVGEIRTELIPVEKFHGVLRSIPDRPAPDGRRSSGRGASGSRTRLRSASAGRARNQPHDAGETRGVDGQADERTTSSVVEGKRGYAANAARAPSSRPRPIPGASSESGCTCKASFRQIEVSAMGRPAEAPSSTTSRPVDRRPWAPAVDADACYRSTHLICGSVLSAVPSSAAAPPMFCWAVCGRAGTGRRDLRNRESMRVRVEHLEQPVGIGDRRPRLSWQLPEDAGSSCLRAAARRRDDDRPGGLAGERARPVAGWRPRLARAPTGAGAGVDRSGRDALVGADRAGGRSARAGRLGVVVGGTRPSTPGTGRASARPTCCAARCTSTSPWPPPGSTSPRTASTRSTSTAGGSAISNWRPDSPSTPHARRCRRTTSRTCSGRAATRSAPCWPTGGTGARSACCAAYDQFGDRTALLAQLHVDHPDGTTTVTGTGTAGPAPARTSWRPT